MYKTVESWIRAAFYLKDNNRGQASFLLEREQQGSRDEIIDRNWLILVALPLRHSLLVISRIKAVTLRLQ